MEMEKFQFATPLKNNWLSKNQWMLKPEGVIYNEKQDINSLKILPARYLKLKREKLWLSM